MARVRGHGRAHGQLPPARLAAVAQRYWGCPIPIVYCATEARARAGRRTPGGAARRRGLQADRESPLATATDWVNTTCPKCGGPARRETDTMDTFVDSSWYFLRFCDPQNDEAPSTRGRGPWMPVDQYIGGIEHAILHLFYARFFMKVLADMALLGAGSRSPASSTRDDPRAAPRCRSRRATSSRRGAESRGLARTRSGLATSSSSGPRRSTPTGRTRGWPACTASCRGSGPPPMEAPEDGSPGERAGRRRRAAPQGALGDRQGHPRHADELRASTPRSPP